MHLLHTVLHTFLMVLLERICCNITTFLACKAGVFWGRIHELLFSGMTLSRYLRVFVKKRLLCRLQHSSLVIIWLILMTCLFDQEVLLLGEIRHWSLLGLNKQLTLSHGHLTIILIITIISCSLPLFKGSSFILPYPCRLLELVLCHLVLVMVTLYSFLILVEHLWAQQHGWVLTVQAAKKKWYKTLLYLILLHTPKISQDL